MIVRWCLVLALIHVGTRVWGAKPAEVCIVGAGIGGSATAKFTRELDPTASITVFERRSEPGGRMKSVRFDNMEKTFEAGASIAHTSNKYILQFAEELNLNIAPPPLLSWGIYDGSKFVFEGSVMTVLNAAKLWWRYGINVAKMASIVQEHVDKFGQIYTLQESGIAFGSPIQLFEKLGLYDCTKVSLAELMVERGIAPKTINEVMAPITRVNYGQNCTLNALAGLISLAGATTDLRVITGGFQQISKGLLQASKASLRVNTTVMEIIPGDDGSYELKLEEGEVKKCDAVVIAAPLEQSSLTITSFGGRIHRREYQHTQTTFVKGKLNVEFFGEKSSVPPVIVTVESEDIVFNSIGRHSPEHRGSAVYRVFSRKPLAKNFLEQAFKDAKVLLTIPWKAYPRFDPPEKFSPFELSKGLVYINTIESAASAMEVSAIGGRNAALLVNQFLHKRRQETSAGDHKIEL